MPRCSPRRRSSPRCCPRWPSVWRMFSESTPARSASKRRVPRGSACSDDRKVSPPWPSSAWRSASNVKVYNTMSRRKDELLPLKAGEVRMYVCGVTVYDFSHIGHARSALVFDVLRRYLRFKGYRVTFVRNYTDVDDRIIRRANEAGVPASEISERYIAAEREDMASLGILPPDVEPKATEHV